MTTVFMQKTDTDSKIEEYDLLDVVGQDNEDSILKNKATGEELAGAITIYGDYITFMTRFTLVDYVILAIIPNGF